MQRSSDLEDIFASGGEMGALLRSLDWSASPLGLPEHWSQSLQITLKLCLQSLFPMALWWGEELVLLSNDAWQRVFGATNQPNTLGQHGQERWAEICSLMGSQLESVLATGQATRSDNALLLIDRNGYIEEAYFTYFHSPILEETGQVGGALTVVTETTQQVLGDRRLRTLRALVTQAGLVETVESACQSAIQTLAENPADIPLALLYRLTSDGKAAILCSSTPFAPDTLASPSYVDLTQSEGDRWSLAEVVQTGQGIVIADLAQRFGALPSGTWEIQPNQALVLPLRIAGQDRLAGLLIVGVNPYRALDDDFRNFFEMVATQITTAIANAFEATMPYLTPASEELNPAIASPADPNLPRRRILLATDNADLRDYLKRLLSQHYQVEAVADGRAALRAIEQQMPNLVLTDMMMPNLNGVELLQQLRTEPQTNSLPLILLSDRADAATYTEGLEARADDYLIKPFSARELLARVEANLKLAELRQNLAQSEQTRQLEAEQAKERYRAFIEQSSEAIWRFELAQPIALDQSEAEQIQQIYQHAYLAECNQTMAAMYEFASAQAMIGMRLDDLLVRSDPRNLEYLQAFIRSGYRLIDAESYEVDRHGQPKIFSNNLVGVIESGKLVRAWGTQQDITARQQAAADLRQSEARARLAIQVGRLGTWRYDPLTHLVELDQRMREIWGEPADVIKIPLAAAIQRIHPNDRARVASAISAALEPNSTGIYEQEYQIVWADGSDRWLSAGGQVQFEGEGEARRMVEFIGTALDITATKRDEVERKLAEAERERLLAAIETERTWLSVVLQKMPAGVMIADAKSNSLVFKNQQARQVVGDFLNEGLLFEEYDPALSFEGFYPDGQRYELENWPLMRSLHQGETIMGEEIELRYADGRRTFISVDAAPIFDGKGQVANAVVVFQDLTQRKQSEIALQQSEERYRYLAESIPQLVWTADAAGMLLDVNQRWSDFTGLTVDQARTNGWQGIVHPDDVQNLSHHWAAAQQDGRRYQAEGRMRRADGVYRWHLHQAVSLKNEAGQAIKWFGTATDIEDQKQLEQQRDQVLKQEQAAREAAERANRIKDEFLAVLSHELRSPLNPILGWSKLLLQRKLDEKKTTHALETIERNARLQTQLIEDLLDVSRILQGKLSLKVTAVDLAATVMAAIETVQLAAAAKSIQIQTALDKTVGRVSGDYGRLQQVVWNLLTNAVKFTPEGGQVEVRLESYEFSGLSSELLDPIQSSKALSAANANKAQRSTQNSKLKTQNSTQNSYAQITVSDTGKGIHSDFLPHVFEYFLQADSTTTREFGGLGLGLAIVHHIVELHGGTVQAFSLGEGQGATFTVKLPLMQSQGNQGKENPNLADPALSLHALQGIQVAIADDDPDSREFIAFMLEQAGANVTAVASSLDLLQALPQMMPDIVVSDIGMPEMDGYMLIQQIRQLPFNQGRNVPAIALTAYASDIDHQQAITAGFQQHLSKPVDPEQLIEAIISLVNRA